MPFAQFLLRENGSNTVGFALVAPILVGCFLAVSQFANLANVQVTLSAAAKSAAREASRYDGDANDAVAEAHRILSAQGISQIDSISVKNVSPIGQAVVRVEIKKKYQIPWLQYELTLSSVGQVVDEKKLN